MKKFKYMTFFIGTDYKLFDKVMESLIDLGYNNVVGIEADWFDPTTDCYLVARPNGVIDHWGFRVEEKPEKVLTKRGLKEFLEDKKHLTPIEEILYWDDENTAFNKI